MFQGITARATRSAIFTSADEVERLSADGKEWNFHDADTSEHLHGLHPYPAKFIPQIPRKAIGLWTNEGELVLDPFCGCGTTLLEARNLRRPSVGIDNNAVACLISRAKTATYRKVHLDRLDWFLKLMGEQSATTKPDERVVPANGNLRYWFSEPVIYRLATIKTMILREDEPIRSLLLAIFSSILVRVSYQDSDTRYAKIDRKVTPDTVDLAFTKKALEVLGRLRDVKQKGNKTPVAIHQADSRSLPFIASKSVALIVTSPPYLNAYDYHKYHRQRLHWIDGDIAAARDLEIGKHDDFTRPGATPDAYFRDMAKCFDEWARVLRTGGKCLIVIGDAIVSKKPVPVADTFIQLLNERKIRLERRWIRELHSTSRAFNIRNSRISHEHVLLFSNHN